jgi:type II secretory pathway predicted ATPase ExeA
VTRCVRPGGLNHKSDHPLPSFRQVLLVDKAQNLTIETLDELGMLTDINADRNPLLQIIRVG